MRSYIIFRFLKAYGSEFHEKHLIPFSKIVATVKILAPLDAKINR